MAWSSAPVRGSRMRRSLRTRKTDDSAARVRIACPQRTPDASVRLVQGAAHRRARHYSSAHLGRAPDTGATLLPYRGRQHAAATDTVSKRQACGINLLNAHERTQHGAETLFLA